MVTHPYLDRAYAACGDGSVVVLDTTTFDTVQRIAVGGDPWDVVLSADAQWLFASDRQSAGLTVIDAQSNTVHTRVTGLGNLGGLEVASDGSTLYASGLSGGVHVLDGLTFERLTTIAGVGDASELAVTCDGRDLYVGNGGDEVPVIDTETRAVADRIGMPGSGAQGIAICPPRVAQGVLLAPGAQARSARRSCPRSRG